MLVARQFPEDRRSPTGQAVGGTVQLPYSVDFGCRLPPALHAGHLGVHQPHQAVAVQPLDELGVGAIFAVQEPVVLDVIADGAFTVAHGHLPFSPTATLAPRRPRGPLATCQPVTVIPAGRLRHL